MGTQTVAVANEKGGVGKTVTVINLAAALALENKKTLVVDMDPQANATRGLGLDPDNGNGSVYDLIQESTDLSLADVITQTAWEGLDIVPAHVDLAGAEVELVDVQGRENRLKDALETLPHTYDVILLDTPPSLSLLTVNVFAYAQQVLIPCQTHPYAFGALAGLYDTVEAIQDEINPGIRVLGILPTFYDSRTRVSQSVLSKLQDDERYRDALLNTRIRSNITIAESAAVGKPIVFYRSTSFGAVDYKTLAQELIDRFQD